MKLLQEYFANDDKKPINRVFFALWAREKAMFTSMLNRVFSAVMAMVILTTGSSSTLAQQPSTNWQEEFAYTLGVQAYIYGFPWINLAAYRWLWVTQVSIDDTHPYAPLNMFYHATKLTDASFTGAVLPTTTPCIPWPGSA